MQLANINPTGPKKLVNTYDKNKNINENTPMYRLYLNEREMKTINIIEYMNC